MADRVEVLRSTTTATPKIMVDRGEETPPVYTVDQAWTLLEDYASCVMPIPCDGTCWWCQLSDVLRKLR